MSKEAVILCLQKNLSFKFKTWPEKSSLTGIVQLLPKSSFFISVAFVIFPIFIIFCLFLLLEFYETHLYHRYLFDE